MTIVTNKKNELVPTRTVTDRHVCINYHKLNEATRKDYFPLPFMDQMLERLAGNKFLCFLDEFSKYFQIPIELVDQEKTTFICPYGTYAYKRMPFGLCNAPATFQQCMIAIFQDMLETSMEEKCHFMVTEGIMLVHKVYGVGMEVDKIYIALIRWILLLQEFASMNQKQEKEQKNCVTANNLLRVENPNLEELRDEDINDNFPNETLMNVSSNDEDKIPWGHCGPSTITKKVFDARFYWPTIFKEAYALVQNCDACQHSGSLS
ncbi:reverse transcriptase domain-containing protein [Tanacetum coccineum]|uniref:Reverse transcriptase domain-containing protein n=1 Tax=Tanacetum coccineum TaxID=301880 RepID=A0ABQ5A152_9ASTR